MAAPGAVNRGIWDSPPPLLVISIIILGRNHPHKIGDLAIFPLVFLIIIIFLSFERKTIPRGKS